MSLPQSVDILVVGAGPTGLCLALALQKHDCTAVLVVDSAEQGGNTSRAIAIHAATLEALDSMGCAEDVMKEARKMSAQATHSKRGTVETATFGPLAKYSKFPFVICIPQHVTERILGKIVQDRHIPVLRPHRATRVQPSAENPNLTDIIFEDGQVVRARVVVGADGSHSTVRESAKIGWADPDGELSDEEDNMPMQLVIADVTLENAPGWPLDKMNFAISTDNIFLLGALPGQPYPQIPAGQLVYRIATNVPASFGVPPHAPDTEYLQKILDAWGPKVTLGLDSPRIIIKQTAWSSRYRTRSSIADTFFARLPTGTHPDGTPLREGGPVVLVGDAAHIHPPIGGQGMNLGIRDAIKLAPALIEYLRTAPASPTTTRAQLDLVDAPLRQWAEERHERALAVIKFVKQMEGLMTLPNERRWLLGIVPYNPAWLRDVFMGIMCRFTWWRARTAWQVSGLGNP
ncbi:FAD/NAD-P-binding domain-containing protein [Cubamyces sp. BRFM 1775]|nr:FAD/NAD-P-binding domain-containing protein [Cubamyces sp. BRFM 1775]